MFTPPFCHCSKGVGTPTAAAVMVNVALVRSGVKAGGCNVKTGALGVLMVTVATALVIAPA